MFKFKHGMALAMTVAGMQFGDLAWSTEINAGPPVVFNFSSPTPGSFTNISFSSGISFCSVAESQASRGCSGVDMPDLGTITAFSELNGAGTSSSAGFWNDSSFTSGFDFAIRPDIASSYFAVDGVFSISFAGSVGNIDASPYVVLTNANGVRTRIDGVPVPVTAVPEPSIFALFSVGVLALGIAGRRRARRSEGASSRSSATEIATP